MTKILFSPLRFVEEADAIDPAKRRERIKNRLKQDLDSLSTYTLSYGRYQMSYQYYLEAQSYLTEDAEDCSIMTRAFRKLPRLTDVVINYYNHHTGAAEIIGNLGLLADEELNFDGEYTIPLFIRALSQANKSLSSLKFENDELPDTAQVPHKLGRAGLDTLSPLYWPRMTALAIYQALRYPGGTTEKSKECLQKLQKLEVDAIVTQHYLEDNDEAEYSMAP